MQQNVVRRLFPGDIDQGDPYLVYGADGVLYGFHTQDGGVPGYMHTGGFQFAPLGNVIADSDPRRAYWAPCLYYESCLAERDEYPNLLIASCSKRNAPHELHRIQVYHSPSMGGLFEYRNPLTPNARFAIDPHVCGRGRFAYSRNMVGGDRPGTGIVIVRANDDLTWIDSRRPLAVLPPRMDCELYEEQREFPKAYGRSLRLPKRFWDADGGVYRVERWFTREGFAGPYVSSRGETFWFYAGGNYRTDSLSCMYFVGVLKEAEPFRRYEDLTLEYRHFLIKTDEDNGILDPGHGMNIKIDDIDWFCCHYREERRPQGTAQLPRRAGLFRIMENENGWPYCLTA